MYEIGGDVTLNAKIVEITEGNLTVKLNSGILFIVKPKDINTYAPPYKSTGEDMRKGK